MDHFGVFTIILLRITQLDFLTKIYYLLIIFIILMKFSQKNINIYLDGLGIYPVNSKYTLFHYYS